MRKVKVLGAGLAGSEAAWQLAELGLSVELIDMKPRIFTPAHSDPNFAELVCSNSLRSTKVNTGSGLLKYELQHFNSLIMEAAEETKIPAGNALAVDRQAFPAYITEKLKKHKNIDLITAQVDDLSDLGEDYHIIATGPLTAGNLFSSIADFSGSENLYFFDAAAPLVENESINRQGVFSMSRYEEGEGDYLNCPFTKEEYLRFYHALVEAERAEVAGFERGLLFEGCKPVEELARDGIDTLRFGPMKPVGLIDPRTGKEPYAVVQLRQDDFASELWNIVGFQTRLKFPHQEKVFRMIPGLEEAKFARYGVMHRNSFICSPRILGPFYRCKDNPKRFFAGQISGVEGYLESCASGLVAALQLASGLRVLTAEHVDILSDRSTMLGSLHLYVCQASPENFQPMKANFSLLDELTKEDIRYLRKKYKIKARGRPERRAMYALRSFEKLAFSEEQIEQILLENKLI